MLSLMIFLWQTHLEDLVSKDATEKSDAAREALLAELALDAKNMNRGGDHSKKIQERSKSKKRTKDKRKAKDLKVLIMLGLMLHHSIRVEVTLYTVII